MRDLDWVIGELTTCHSERRCESLHEILATVDAFILLDPRVVVCASCCHVSLVSRVSSCVVNIRMASIIRSKFGLQKYAMLYRA